MCSNLSNKIFDMNKCTHMQMVSFVKVFILSMIVDPSSFNVPLDVGLSYTSFNVLSCNMA